MRCCRAYPCVILLCGLWMLWGDSPSRAADEPAQGKIGVFFSQGQAVYNSQDRAQSQQAAVQDFLSQAVIQAMSSFLSPSQMGSQFAPLQDKILRQPERYVETYQIFSESPMNGLYRVTGQVTVGMDLLKQDLLQMGLVLLNGRSAAPQPAPASSASPEGSLGPPASAGDDAQMKITPPANVSGKQQILWAVAEKWDKEWFLPMDLRDPHGLFGINVLQESQQYEWALRLPQPGTITVDDTGSISPSQALSLAKGMGINKVIMGNVAMKERQNQAAVLEATLRVLNVSTGKSQGEIRRAWTMGDTTNQEGAMELAMLITPQMDRLLQDSSRPATFTPAPATDSARNQTRASPPASAPATVGAGEWLLVIRSNHPYEYWEELEKLLRDRSKSVQIKDMELSSEGAKVRIEGVDGQFFTSLQGARLPGGAQVQVGRLSPDSRTVDLSFVSMSVPQPEIKQ